MTARVIEIDAEPFAASEALFELGFSDGLPLVPPTEGAVEAMLEAVALPPDTVIGAIAPDDNGLTVEKAAINSVMAGCRPEYFATVIAAARAVVQPRFNLLGIQSTTNPVSPVLVINGPVRSAIGINCGRGCLGPGARANATIGRALNLILVNVGGAVRRDVDKTIHGMPGKFTFCFGEFEEESPWEPFHTELGFEAAQSTVTAFGGQGTQNVIAAYHDPANVVHMLADAMRCYGNNSYHVGRGDPLVILPPGHASRLAAHGWTKQRLKHDLYEMTKVPRRQIPQERLVLESTWNGMPDDDSCSICASPDDIRIVVAGGPEAYHICYVPSFGHTAITSQAID